MVRSRERQRSQEHSSGRGQQEQSQSKEQEERAQWIKDIRDSVPIKHDQVFMLTSEAGDIHPKQEAHGIFFHDTCFLDQLEIHVGGASALSLLGEAERGFEGHFELTNHDIQMRDGRQLKKEKLSIRRTWCLRDVIEDQLEIRNMDQDGVDIDLTIAFGASFRSVFEIRGGTPGKRGAVHAPVVEDGRLVLAYDGADQHYRATTISFLPQPERIQDGVATYRIRLKPREVMSLTLGFDLLDRPPNGRGPTGKTHTAFSGAHIHQQFSDAISQVPHITTSHSLLNRALQRSFADVRMLATTYGEDTFISAGIPWFVALFGRDSLVASFEVLAYQPDIARTTVDVLSKYQGTRVNDFQQEAPGKILHELRVGERANLREIPQFPYYGSVESTPWFLLLLGAYVRWTGDLAFFRTHRNHVERALQWIEDNLAHGLSGFLDYQNTSSAPNALRNQGWKDSDNSIVNEDGSLATPPIALVEVQGVLYEAWRAIGDLYRLSGNTPRATLLERQAEDLKRHFNQRFWLEDKGFYALCLQQGERPAKAIASNPGQALFSHIVDDDKARAVADRLMASDMFGGWGVRTLAASEVAYNPLDYQVGTYWPHDNALIALGLKRYGFDKAANRIFTCLLEAATHFEHYRLPEVLAGFGRDEFTRPVHYPTACSPQAWGAGALPLLLQAALGLEPDACRNVLRIHRPSLPDWLNWVAVHGLRVGHASVDLRFERHNDITRVTVLGQQGDLLVESEG